MMRRVLLTVCLVIGFTRQSAAEEFVTNPLRSDGFGAQFQTIIYAMLYAEMNQQTFLYSPFVSMEHNYDNDPDFIKKKEWLANVIDYFPHNNDVALQTKISVRDFVVFFDQNIGQCIETSAFKNIKEIFRVNKDRSRYFDDEHLHIAGHIRRSNSHDNRVDGTDTPDSVYLNIINNLRQKYLTQRPLFHIYSQGRPKKFRKTFLGDDIVLHINASIEETFTSMVLADVLVLSRSSFSYTAGLLSNGTVYYMRFWVSPLPSWIEVKVPT
ncbi:MAG: hypothetical protein ACHQT8_00950 [Chlamydiales bacterium]